MKSGDVYKLDGEAPFMVVLNVKPRAKYEYEGIFICGIEGMEKVWEQNMERYIEEITKKNIAPVCNIIEATKALYDIIVPKEIS